MPSAPVVQVFERCVAAMRSGLLIHQPSRTDKEFHFQNWFQARIVETGLNCDQRGRNTYPDFCLVDSADGFEVKGLAYPGRYLNYDSNSQVPSGEHRGRAIYYVFGRYPAKPDGDRYPVLDLVICHGDFLNARHDYKHLNRSVRGFGSYGDIMIRDRKMYVAPTPFGLIEGVAHHATLILPDQASRHGGMIQVGTLVRQESAELIVGYHFDLRTNDLTSDRVPNPGAGRQHAFTAWRVKGDPADAVTLRPPREVEQATANAAAEADEDEG